MDLLALGAISLGLVWGWVITPHSDMSRTLAFSEVVETVVLIAAVFSVFDLAISVIALISVLIAMTIQRIWLESLIEGDWV
jgi:predicted membrane-bound spermidine synthase